MATRAELPSARGPRIRVQQVRRTLSRAHGNYPVRLETGLRGRFPRKLIYRFPHPSTSPLAGKGIRLSRLSTLPIGASQGRAPACPGFPPYQLALHREGHPPVPAFHPTNWRFTLTELMMGLGAALGFFLLSFIFTIAMSSNLYYFHRKGSHQNGLTQLCGSLQRPGNSNRGTWRK